MIHAYDEMYVEGAMIRMGDMLEYACLDCGYAPDGFWRMFLQSEVARRFDILLQKQWKHYLRCRNQ